ncbi:hypothetical protein IIA15_01965 [candidate division TA06 bacterium]|nr:hypothetical protein [candidate division TA06 bacterium]
MFCIFHLTFFISVEASTQIWKVKNQEEFLEGKTEGTTISSDGTITLSPQLDTLYETGELYIWSLAADGKNIYAGTGNDGRIFKITSEGKGSVFSHLKDEIEILSLALDRNGFLYAGTGPGGKIYKISTKGEAQLFFESGETYVWSMVFHPNGVLYAGTGENGKIYSISKDGKGKVLYDTEENHILSLHIHRKKIFAGTSSSGLFFEFNTQGEGRVLYDAPFEEVRSILNDQEGNLWIGATSPEEKSGEFSIYRISKERDLVYPVVSLPYLLLSMSLDQKGNLIVGTGDASLLEVKPDGKWRLLLEVPTSQVLQLLPLTDQSLLGTGNLGNLYRMKAQYRNEGDYLSRIHDAETLSRWGVIHWEGESPSETKVLLQTRSGNTEKVDGTWSPWSNLGAGLKPSPTQGRIKSPPARFLQWRARLTTRKADISPILKEVSVAYLQRNLSPKVLSVTLYPPGLGVGRQVGQQKKMPPIPSKKREELKKKGVELPSGAFLLEKGFRSIGWKGEDANGDSLVYFLYFRGVGEKNWKVMKERVAGEGYIFDTSAFPDGQYEIRVVAKDTPNNPDPLAGSGEKVSEIFTIDNTPPKVENIRTKSQTGGTFTITFEVEDETSTLRECAYAIDGQEWRPLYPSDEVFDTSVEAFEFRTEGLPKGEHVLMIKAEDSLENVGAGKKSLNVQ